jgi:hypothetical protein
MKRLLAAAAVLYSAAHFAAGGVRQPLRNFQSDFLAVFPSYRLSAVFWRLDLFYGSLAESWAGRFGRVHSWHYGPQLHLLTMPLFLFPTLRSAYLAWLVVSWAMVVGTAILAVYAVDRGRPTLTTSVVVFVLFCNFNPLYEALTQRNIELIELFLLVGAFVALQRGRELHAGIAVGLAAMMKFLPLIFVPHFVLKRRWDGLAGAVQAIAFIAALTQLVLGWQNSGILHQLMGGAIIDSELDQSVTGMVTRVFRWTHLNASVGIVSRLIIAAALAGLCVLMLRVRHLEGADDVEWSVLFVAMVLLLPHNQQYYFVFLLFPYLMLYARYRERWSWRAVPAAVSLLLVAAPLPFSLFGANAFSRYLSAGIPFVGAVILAAVVVLELSACRVQFPGRSQHVPGRDVLESQRLPQ